MPTESFVASTLTSDKDISSSSSAFKDVGICLHELQPHLTPRHNYKKSSTERNCLAVSESHIFAAQAGKAVIHVYNRDKGNQEATVPFPERIHSLAYLGIGSALLVIGTAEGRLILWELASGRQVASTTSHLQAVSSLVVTNNHGFILSGSADSSVHVWSLPNLMCFSQDSTLSTGNTLRNTPLRTFSNHRSGISAISCGHSRTATNFAVSASDDDYCYIWSIDSCEILRVILLPSTPLCFAIDPADRAIYAGYSDGSIQYIDLFQTGLDGPIIAIDSVHDVTSNGPAQIVSTNNWSAASAGIGAAQCLCLSYDGTRLLSGHSSGIILSWDVAKCRVQRPVADFGRNITNLVMLRPDGLPDEGPVFQIRAITKPKLEYSLPIRRGTTGIPPRYTLQGQIVPQRASTQPATPAEDWEPQDHYHIALTSQIFSQDMIDDAIKDLSSTSQAGWGRSIAQNTDLAKVENLEEQIVKLNSSLQQYATAAERSRARRMARMEKREELGFKKRSAYFEAKAQGQDGDKAMQEWEEKERAVDACSDDEETGDGIELRALESTGSNLAPSGEKVSGSKLEQNSLRHFASCSPSYFHLNLEAVLKEKNDARDDKTLSNSASPEMAAPTGATERPPPLVHIIRHGQALHNVERGYPHRDPPLTEAGKSASKDIRLSTVPDLIIISPMTRTIQTAEVAFGPLIDKLPAQVDIQVWPELREADDSICNKGISRAAMMVKFPQMDFDKCPDQWDHPPHSTEGATIRAETVRRRLKQLTSNYKNIALITHRGFISFLVPGEKFDVCETRCYRFAWEDEIGGR